jgi:hypothetical protein
LATYEIYKKDGTPVRVQGPNNLSFEQVISLYEQEKVEQPKPRKRTLPPGFAEATFTDRVGETFKGIGKGVLEVFEQGIEGTSQLLPEKQEQYVREKVTSGIGSLRDKYTRPDMWQQIALEDPDASLLDVGPRKFGEALGSFAGIGATAVLPYVGIPAALGLVVAGGAEEQRDRAIAAGKLDELSVRDRLLGAGVGAFEMFAPLKAFKMGGGNKGIQSGLDRIKRALTTGGIEGAQEASAQAAQNWIEQTGYNPQVDIKEGTGEAAGYGTAVGAFAQGFLDLAIRSRGRPATTTVAEELERVTETPKLDDDLSTKAAGAPIVGADGQSDLGFGQVKKVKTKSKEAQAKALGVPTLTKKEIKQRDKDMLDASPKEEQLETFLPNTDLGTKPEISEKEKYESIIKGIPEKKTPSKTEAVKTEPDQPSLIDSDKGTAQAIENIVKKQLQAKEDGTTIVEQGGDGTRVEDSISDAGRTSPDRTDTEGTKTLGPEGLGGVRGDTRPDDGRKGQEPSTLTRPGQDLINFYRRTGNLPVYNDKTIKTFKDNDVELKDENDIQRAIEELDKKAGEQVPPKVATTEKEPSDTDNLEQGLLDLPDPSPPLDTIDTSKVQVVEAQEMLKSIMTPEDLEKAGMDIGPSALAEGIKALERKIGTGILRAERKRVQKTKVTKDEAKIIEKKYQASKEKGELSSAAGRFERGKQTREEQRAKEKREQAQKEEVQIGLNRIFERKGKRTGPKENQLLKKFYDENLKFEEPKTSIDEMLKSEDLRAVGRLVLETDSALEKQMPSKIKGQVSPAISAKRYFMKSPDVTYVLDLIIEDKTSEQANYRTTSEATAEENAHFKYTGNKPAENALLWVKNNFDKDTVASLDILYQSTEVQYQGTGVTTDKYGAAVNLNSARREAQMQNQRDYEAQLKRENEEASNDIHSGPNLGKGLNIPPKIYGNTDQAKELVQKNKAAIKAENAQKAKQKTQLKETKTEKPKPKSSGPDLDILNNMYSTLIKSKGNLGKDKGLEASAVLQTSLPIRSEAIIALRQGDLKKALRIMAINNDGEGNRQLAKGFFKNVGTTKIEIVDDLKLDSGGMVAGLFDPRTNTVKLDSKIGINIHTLFHELSHANTDAKLSNPSHPVTKQLEALFKEIKGHLGDFYGSRNLREFVAEGLSNPAFRANLKNIYIRGKQHNALDRFIHSISNFIRGLLGKPQITLPEFKKYVQFKSPVNQVDTTNSEEELTRLTNQILSAAPQNRDDGQQGLDAHAVIKDIQDMSKKTNLKTKGGKLQWLNDFTTWGKGAVQEKTPGATGLALGFLDDQLVGDILNYQDRKGTKGFDGLRMRKIVQQQEKDVNQQLEKVEGSMEGIKKRLNKNDAKIDAFNTVVSLATLYQANPNLTEAQARQKYKDDNKAMNAWTAMRSHWNTLGREGREAYEILRQTYLNQFRDLKNVVFQKIDGIENLSITEKKTLKEKIYGRLFNESTIDPYFPLVRTGQYWLSFTGKDPITGSNKEKVVMAFESIAERDQAVNQLKTKYNVDAQPFLKEEAMDKVYARAPSDSFMAKALDMLQKNKVRPSVQKELMDLFIEALPETSFAKSFTPREGTLGFKQDALEGLKTKGNALARQIAKLKNAQAINKELERLDKLRIEGDLTNFERALVKELEDRGKFALNPPPDNWAKNLNRVAFTYTLGFNISSTVVNFSQIPLMFMPYLGGRYGYVKTTKAIFDSMALYKNSGTSRQIRMGAKVDDTEFVSTRAMPSIDNYFALQEDGSYKVREDVLKDKTKTKEFKDKLVRYEPLIEAAAAQAGRSLWFDSLGVEGVKRGNSLFDRFSMYSAFLFHQQERMNRQVALTSSYDLELNRLNSPEATPIEQRLSTREKQLIAAENAIYQAQKINGGALLVNAPRHAQKGWGRVALMYKSYGLRMIGTMLQITYEGVYNFRKSLGDKDPQARKEARIALKQSIGILGSSVLLAGLQGAPFAGGAFLVMNGVLMLLGEDDETAESITRAYVGETWYRGPATDLIGADISRRVGMSNLLFRANPYREPGLGNLLLELGMGPAGSILSQTYNGIPKLVSALDDGNVTATTKAIGQMSPAAFRNIFKGVGFAVTGEYRTARGSDKDIITEDISLYESMLQTAGLIPKRISYQLQKSSFAKEMDIRMGKTRSSIMKRLWMGWAQGDSSIYARAFKDMQKYNRKYPSNPITPKDIQRSMRRHGETGDQMVNGIFINKGNRAAIDLVMDDWEDSTRYNVFF